MIFWRTGAARTQTPVTVNLVRIPTGVEGDRWSELFRLVFIVRDVLLVAAALPSVEVKRRRLGPGPLVACLRQKGRAAQRRTAEGRADLQRAIALVDRLLPGEPSCYRRVLLEIGLDAGAAEEPIHMGLRVPGGPRSGHAWLAGSPDAPSVDRVPYDVQVDI
jgi:hypothetical protein